MNDEDMVLYHQAGELVCAGQMQAAHALFCQLRAKSVLPDVNVLVGIAYTTVDAAEAEDAIASIRLQQPDHPQLASLQAMHQRKLQGSSTPMGPALRCPYCGNFAPTRFGTKTATGGWIVFVVLLIICFPLCWLGFLIHEKFYTCARCSSKITTANW